MIDRPKFFRRIRRSLFQGRLGRQQVEGLEAIIDTFQELNQEQPADPRHLAYILATAHHETGRRFQPIREIGSTAYLTRNYDILGGRPRLAKANGNTEPGDGVRYAGRGFVQLTWRNNYRVVGRKLGIDLEHSPHMALKSDVAALILVRGMQEGWFTGWRLAQCFNTTSDDWIKARRIVNGRDKAGTIAAYGRAYFQALKETHEGVTAVKTVKVKRRASITSVARQPLLTKPSFRKPVQKQSGKPPQSWPDPFVVEIGNPGS